MTSARSGFSPQLMAEAARGSAMMANMATKTNITQVAPPGPNNENAKFPVQISTTDPEDAKWALRQRIVSDAGITPRQGMAIAPPEFFDYAKRKMDDQEETAFKAWVLQQADLSEPEKVKWWFEHFPWMKTSREEVIDYVADVQRQAAKIALNGPQSEEDFRFLFMKQNGLITVPDQPVQSLDTFDWNRGATYQRGFFSPISGKLMEGYPAIKHQDTGFQWANPLTATPARAGLITPAIWDVSNRRVGQLGLGN